ncbi:IucA/IucC family C-terminal-domain containing protein [Candidatus Symbiopectobacterium sp. NZEC135]|uniref:IucA/IucC family C-terminal-domain containing protein n=1 Tax=Candidatus Symbiopectobacterium sp. NZEC135 TaxID=2820471 RepID=UPI002227BDE7|nr:IucA/IucC family C-terminal-domain containing protein [Candidatus Symbiopectobacterium sp. NZEC135]MCW2479777.1 (2Fe-2S)-binding protein [Candidatus Symbiopectobacterium sp. NZEC135]
MCDLSFHAEERAHLAARFNLIAAADYPFSSVLPVSAMLETASCQRMLQQLAPRLGAPSLGITASLLSKRVAFLTTAAAFYPLSMYNKGLHMALTNCLLDTRHDGHLWQSHMVMDDLSLSIPLSDSDRASWRDTILRSVFAEHLTPLWHVLSAASGISSRILWENTAVRLFSLFEHRMQPADAATEARVKQDFHYVVHEAPGALFGLDANPLTGYFRPLTWVAAKGEWVRFRRTCCFYYKASQPQAFCQACPLLRPDKSHRLPFRNKR